MTWTVKDRRTDAPSDEERAEAEDDRMRKRLSLREEIAALRMKLDRAELLKREIAAIDARIDAAADLHSSTTAPLQDELEALEARAIQRIAARTAANAEEDGRRRDIIAEITTANRLLEEVTQREQSLKRPLEGQIFKLTNEAAPIGALQNKLAQIPLANPTLLREQFAAHQRTAAHTARRAAATRALHIVGHNVEQITLGRMDGNIYAQRNRLACWQHEAEVAAQDEADALATSSAVHQQMVDE